MKRTRTAVSGSVGRAGLFCRVVVVAIFLLTAMWAFGGVSDPPGYISKDPSGYLMFEPWDGSWDDMRISWELAIALAKVLNRVLVLPPTFRINYLDGTPAVPVSEIMDLSTLHHFVPFITLDQWRELHRGPHSKAIATRWHANTRQSQEIHKLFDGVEPYVTSTNPPWRATWNLVFAPDKAPEDDLREFSAGRGIHRFSDGVLQGETIHFPQNLFGPFYAVIYTPPGKERLELTQGIRDHFQYHPKIIECGRKIAQHMGRPFVAIHVHRGDFSINRYRPEGWQLAQILSLVLDLNEPVFVDTNEDYFLYWHEMIDRMPGNPVRFIHNFLSPVCPDVPFYMAPMVSQVVCAHARLFAGTRLSTHTAYIQRLRGYMGFQEPMRFVHGEISPEEPRYTFAANYWNTELWGREYSEGWQGTVDNDGNWRRVTQFLHEDKIGDSCWAGVRSVLRIWTGTAQPSTSTSFRDDHHLCSSYRNHLAMHVCPAKQKLPAIIAHGFMDDGYRMEIYKEHLNELVRPYVVDGKYLFMASAQVFEKADIDKYIKDYPRMKGYFLDKVIFMFKVLTDSFQNVYGSPLLLIADNERTQRELKRNNMSSIVDFTPIRREPFGGGNRRTSRTLTTKYFFMYWLLQLGYVITFMDADSFWLRKLQIPTDAQLDGIFSFEYRQPIPHRASSNVYEFSKLPTVPLSTNNFWYCHPQPDHLSINGGFYTFFPTENTLRLIGTMVDFQYWTWNAWFEQNLLSYMLFHYTSFGYRMAFWDTDTHNVYGEMPQLTCKERPLPYAWVHCKRAELWAECRDAIARDGTKPPPKEYHVAPITLQLKP